MFAFGSFLLSDSPIEFKFKLKMDFKSLLLIELLFPDFLAFEFNFCEYVSKLFKSKSSINFSNSNNFKDIILLFTLFLS